jgi:hypothetical protein
MIFTLPSPRTAPAGTPSFGLTVHSRADSGRVAVPLGLVFGFGRSLEAGVQLDDVFSAPSAGDTSGVQGAVKWRLVESWHWSAAIAALGWRSLTQQGPEPTYGAGVRFAWAGSRSAVTVSVDGWSRGGAEIGAALERAAGTHGVVALEARGRRGTGEGVLSLRHALGENATVAIGGGARSYDSRVSPVVVLAIGVVPRSAYLVARTPRAAPVPADTSATGMDVVRAVPDLAAAMAREQAEDSAQRARVVVPLAEAVPVEPVGGAAVWRWNSDSAAAAPPAEDVRGLAALILAARCPGAVDARIEGGSATGAEQADAVRRTLVLLGVAPDRITVLLGVEAAEAGIVVRLSDVPSVRCPEQG